MWLSWYEVRIRCAVVAARTSNPRPGPRAEFGCRKSSQQRVGGVSGRAGASASASASVSARQRQNRDRVSDRGRDRDRDKDRDRERQRGREEERATERASRCCAWIGANKSRDARGAPGTWTLRHAVRSWRCAPPAEEDRQRARAPAADARPAAPWAAADAARLVLSQFW